jgi:polyhydroxybutyrate depolymerase
MIETIVLRRIMRMLIPAAIAVATTTSWALACGRDTGCMVGDRSYRIVLPDTYDGDAPIGAIVFAHGYRGTARGIMRSKGLTGLSNNLGVAFIAAQADGPEWIIPGIPSSDHRPGVDDLAYFDALIADASTRFAIDPARLVASGFSSGGMMTWHLACYRGAAFNGFVPMSGTFWAPVPQNCPSGPVDLIHYHGDADPVVPLGGRPIGDAHQGDVQEAIALISRIGGYQPVETEPTPGLDCTRQVNGDGKLLEFCLFAGKHQLKAMHLAHAWRIFDVPKGQ